MDMKFKKTMELQKKDNTKDTGKWCCRVFFTLVTLSNTTWNKLNNRGDLRNQKLSATTETNLKHAETNGTTETTHNNLKQTKPGQTTRS